MKSKSIVLGGGCFWCIEAVYQRVKGVTGVVSGYSGGSEANPSYDAVCTGLTSHAEVVQVSFDPDTISLQTILQIFWAVHDPTTLNQQGNDIGTQYRSIIFYENESQKNAAENSIMLDAVSLWGDHIVTEIQPLKKFWPAEQYHQNYFNSHPEQAYCQIIINPKVAKLKQKFAHLFIEI